MPQRARINATRIHGPNEAKARILVGPIVTEMAFWPDFFDCRSSVYNPVEQGSIYGHCVAVIGYSATGWVIKNSMGPSWGDHGVTAIPYGRCGSFAPLPSGMPHSDGFALSIA